MPKTRLELEHAHLLLIAALEIGMFPKPEQAQRVLDALSFVCWALGHDHDNKFAALIVELRKELHILGVHALGGPGRVQ